MPPVAITIDTEFPDRPAADPLGSCDRLLALLAERRVKATFFIVGAWAEANPDRVRAICDAGHLIGSHGYSHCVLSRLTEAGIVDDLTAGHDVLADLGVESRPWFRAPKGILSHPEIDVPAAVERAGYEHTHWHARGEDWAPGRSAEDVATAIVSEVRDRWPRPAIVLLHSWPDPAAGALELVLDRLGADGAKFLTLEELNWRHAVAGRVREAATRRRGG